MNKIRIGYVIDQFATGGTERQLQLLIDSIDTQIIKPYVFLLRGEKYHSLMPEQGSIHMLEIRRLASIEGLSKIYRFSRFLRKEKINIVQTFFQDATIVGTMAGRLAGVDNIIICIRDMMFWGNSITLSSQKIMMRLADQLLVNSMAVRDKVNSIYWQVPVKVLYNGIPTGRIFDRTEEAGSSLRKELGIGDEPIVVLVSNCNRRVKRVDLLVESIPGILGEARAFFVVVGDGWIRPVLEKRAVELGIEKHIKFTGIRNDVEHILRGADIALNTSESEGFSNSVMEAMRAGLPVVASNVSGNRELVEDKKTGLLFESGSVHDLKEKLIFLLNRKACANELGRNGKMRIEENFDIGILAKQYMNFYQSLMG